MSICLIWVKEKKIVVMNVNELLLCFYLKIKILSLVWNVNENVAPIPSVCLSMRAGVSGLCYPLILFDEFFATMTLTPTN